MATADRFRRIADRHRALPGRLGLREHSVTLVKTSWSGGRVGVGTRSEESTPLLVNGHPMIGPGVNPKVQFPNQRDVALGLVSLGTITIGPITPDYGTGGTERNRLAELLREEPDSLHLLVTGPQHPNGAMYRIQNIDSDKALHFRIIAVITTGN